VTFVVLDHRLVTAPSLESGAARCEVMLGA
jgi:hypothetical protein